MMDLEILLILFWMKQLAQNLIYLVEGGKELINEKYQE